MNDPKAEDVKYKTISLKWIAYYGFMRELVDLFHGLYVAFKLGEPSAVFSDINIPILFAAAVLWVIASCLRQMNERLDMLSDQSRTANGESQGREDHNP